MTGDEAARAAAGPCSPNGKFSEMDREPMVAGGRRGPHYWLDQSGDPVPWLPLVLDWNKIPDTHPLVNREPGLAFEDSSFPLA